jgi:hypothetical protein
MSRTSTWKEGDTIIDCRWCKPRIIQSIKHLSSFDVIRTKCGKNIIGEDVEYWDLIIPDLIFSKEEQRNDRTI